VNTGIRAAIAGVAAPPVTRRFAAALRDVAAETALAALTDAGVGPDEVDGLFCSPPGLAAAHGGFMWSCTLAHHLGITTKAQALVECGGLTAALCLKLAVREVEAGRCRAALCVAIDARAVDPGDDVELFLKHSTSGLIGLYGPYDGVYGLGAPVPYYAMSAQRYMHEHGVSHADLAEVAVALRGHASKNPRAEMRRLISVDDVLASRCVCPPLTLLECAPFSSGAAAVVVVPERRATKGGDAPAIVVTAIGEHHEPAHFAPRRGSLTRFESATRAAAEAYAESGKGPADIDVAEIYGVFSATELMLYEDLGFVARGQAARAVKEGLTRGQGTTVMNPSGGRLSLGHPAGATPLLSTVEVVEQLRGAAGERQVDGARVGLVHAEHGLCNGSVVIVLEAAC
jgi:acetyl-CoA acetyltransferase